MHCRKPNPVIIFKPALSTAPIAQQYYLQVQACDATEDNSNSSAGVQKDNNKQKDTGILLSESY